ncbi:MAG: hypothetical protein Ct9H90mP9_0140 [Pseudomonadota bacterium]|nr:MAG: hypothetical protein Ct9H90mP9_0140 [Pseudomonadota bacterium]
MPEFPGTGVFLSASSPYASALGAFPAKRMGGFTGLKEPGRCRMKNCPYGGCLQQFFHQIVEALEQRLKELN